MWQCPCCTGQIAPRWTTLAAQLKKPTSGELLSIWHHHHGQIFSLRSSHRFCGSTAPDLQFRRRKTWFTDYYGENWTFDDRPSRGGGAFAAASLTVEFLVSVITHDCSWLAILHASRLIACWRENHEQTAERNRHVAMTQPGRRQGELWAYPG